MDWIKEIPDLLEIAPAEIQSTGQCAPQDRLTQWQRKLLDLSLRNNLLNFKGGKKSIKLESPNPGALEDLLATGQALKLIPHPEMMSAVDPRAESYIEARERENIRQVHALRALEKCTVFVDISKDEL